MGEAPPLLPGRSAEDIVESGGDPIFSRALTLQMLGSELEGAVEEFKYDDEEKQPLSGYLVQRCGELLAWLGSLSINEENRLTPDRVYPHCGGDGNAGDENGCEECDGDGCVLP